jgi:hypothetical protein
VALPGWLTSITATPAPKPRSTDPSQGNRASCVADQTTTWGSMRRSHSCVNGLWGATAAVIVDGFPSLWALPVSPTIANVTSVSLRVPATVRPDSPVDVDDHPERFSTYVAVGR